MILVLLLLCGSVGAVGSAWGLSRGGRSAQVGAIIGGLALAAVVVLALALDAPRVGTGRIPEGVGLLDGRLIPNNYMRLVIALWAIDAALVVFVGWLAGGLAGLRGLMPAMLASIVGGSVAFAATNLSLGAAAAGATGFCSLVVLLAVRTSTTIPAAARELRVTIISTVLLLASIAVAPVAAGLAIRAAHGGSAGDVPGGAAAAPGGPEAIAVVGFLVLAIAIAVALRAGVIPFHLRVPRLVDVAPPLSAPLLLAWVPLPLAVVGLAVVDGLLAPLAVSLAGEQWIVIAVAVVTLVAAALAAFLQDDLRHATGYLVISDWALVLLGFAALDPGAWGPARTWLVALAASKTALAAWAAVVEGRFGTRSIPDLRGWMRRSPILAAALLVTTAATYGLPTWASFEARVDLAQLTGGAPLDAILVIAGFLTLPTYLRLLAVGTGSTTTRVERAAPERIARTRRVETLAVELEAAGPVAAVTTVAGSRAVDDRSITGTVPVVRRAARRSGGVASKGATHAGRRLMSALRRDATELTAAAVLAMAVLAALTSWGVLDIGGAASEPAPIVSNAATD